MDDTALVKILKDYNDPLLTYAAERIETLSGLKINEVISQNNTDSKRQTKNYTEEEIACILRNPDSILTVAEASQVFFQNKVSYWALLKMYKQKSIPGFKVGNRVYFRVSELNKWATTQAPMWCR